MLSSQGPAYIGLETSLRIIGLTNRTGFAALSSSLRVCQSSHSLPHNVTVVWELLCLTVATETFALYQNSTYHTHANEGFSQLVAAPF